MPISPETRRGLAALLAGVAASLLGLMTTSWLRAGACRDAGGQWNDVARACSRADAPAPLWHAAAGAAVGIVALLVLWRTFTFFADRGRQRPSR